MENNQELGVKWYSVFDWPLFFLTLLISFFSVVVIYSANFTSDSEFIRSIYLRQLEWNFYGLFLLVLLAALDYRILERPAYIVYFIFIVLLVKVLLSARVISGSQRWLPVGGMNLQPSELMKVVLIIALARYYNEERGNETMGFRQLLLPAVIALIPVVLIAKQPDMGTAMIYMAIFVVITFVNGIKRETLVATGVGALVLIPAAWYSLRDYQKSRIFAMWNPSADPLGAGYHTIQSKIAVGSGGLFGKGFFAGTQSKLNFLPEKHTDFIFAVFAEEAGFVGTMLLLILYFIMILRMIDVILKTKDKAGSLMAAGVTAMFGVHFFYNVAMTLGLTPIVGIPLPLLSYGGSALLANYAAVGLLLSIHMRRFRQQ
ncbi:MAG: rod shape-determining protein RodA [bacterium]|nr:MAG: rod shape-determining protein RodA [bacterium]